MEKSKDILFYCIHYPSTEPSDCYWETDVEHISRDRSKVEDYFKKEDLSEQDNRIDKFESEINITGSKIWIIFSYSEECPSCAEIEFLGNTREECLEWWKENWTNYIEYNPEEGEEAPEFIDRYGDYVSGLMMKEMEIL